VSNTRSALQSKAEPTRLGPKHCDAPQAVLQLKLDYYYKAKTKVPAVSRIEYIRFSEHG